MRELLLIFGVSIVAYIVSMLWYSPLLFGTQWRKLTKVKSKKPETSVMVVAFLQTLVFTLVSALIVTYTGYTTIHQGIVLAAVIWLGFYATTMLGPVLWKNQPMQLFWIDSMHHLVVLEIVVIIFVLWL